MGFTHEGGEISPRPACVLCNEVLQNNSMVPSKLRRHFEKKKQIKYKLLLLTYVKKYNVSEDIYAY
jgi:hypothetical protein